MTPQEIQLADDLGKIGIPVLGTVAGAVVGALSTFIVTRLNHRNDSVRENAKRRHELLIQCANDITEFEHVIGMYAVAVSNKVLGIDSAVNLEDSRQAIAARNQPVRRARMALRLLGLDEASRHLEEYLDLTREVLRSGTSLDKERAAELSQAIVRGPAKVYDALAAEFRLT